MRTKSKSCFSLPTCIILFIIGALFTAACSINENKHQDSYFKGIWEVKGPGGGGGIMKPAVSPFDENIVMTHCDMTAAYISLDGGESWSMKNLWNVPVDFEFDPLDENVIYVATRGFRHEDDRGSGISMLFRSSDKGKSWRIVFPDVKKAKEGLEKLQSYDYLPSEIIDGAIDATVEKLAVDPLDNNNIYLGMSPLKYYIGGTGENEIPDSVILVSSSDHGNTWSVKSKMPGKIIKAVFSPGETGLTNEIVAFTQESCFWVNTVSGKYRQMELPVDQVIAVEGGRSYNKSMIYIQSAFSQTQGVIEGGMFISMNNGESWKKINNGLTTNLPDGMVPSFRSGLAVCETQPEVTYISATVPEMDSNNQLVRIYSVYKTINGGEEWIPVLRSSSRDGYLTNNYKGSWLDDSYGPGWGGAPIDLGVAPSNPDICFAGDNGRCYKTSDGGKTWQQTYSHNLPDGSFKSSGLDVTTCYGIHFDPFINEHFFICYTDIGLFHTFNGGESWQHSINGVPREWVNTCYDLQFDPDVKGRAWSVWANAHDLPRKKMFGPGGFDNYKGGVTVTNDHGKSWERSSEGIPENAICTSILIDTSSPSEKRTLYVSVFDKGIYKSEDDGKSWFPSNNGLGENRFVWELRRNEQGRLFALCSRGFKNNKTVDGVIFYSDNEAGNWQQMTLPEGVNGPHDLLINQHDHEVMYLSCWPVKSKEGDINGGLFKTEDGGTTWKQVFDQRIRVNSAAIDPKHPNIVFINTFHNAAYRSDNYGENWQRIEGYRFKWGQKPVPDPHHPGMLFLTTYGGSVFYGPAKGVPGISEDIENMPEGWW